MRKVRTAVLTGIAALAVAGVGLAAGRDMHSMKVDLPDGSVAHIEYQGDVAPRVTFVPASHLMPVDFVGPFDSSAFAAFDRIAAEMDRQTEAMIHEVSDPQPALSPGDGKLHLAALGKLPPGTVHYRFVSTSDGSGTCDRSIEVTSYGSDQKPKVISSSSGDCKAVDRALAPAGLDAPARLAVPGLTRTDATATAARPQAGTTV
jgi:hypothetical protein